MNLMIQSEKVFAVSTKRKSVMSEPFKVGGIELDSPVMIAAGAAKTPAAAAQWMRSSASAVENGSYTPKESAGNEGSKLFYPATEEEFIELG
jgi:dihydroorotate dehydrogenase